MPNLLQNMNLFGIQLYKKRIKFHPLNYYTRKTLEISLKSLVMIILPLFPTIIMTTFWYFVIYKSNLNLDQSMESIIVAAWIPMFGLIYSLLAAVVFNTVWSEYKTIRTSIKRYDIETFVDLRDEAISPLVYILILICSVFIIGGFMALKYNSLISGEIVVGSTTYLLSLIFFVIREMDDPCAGFWFIKHIYPEWLEIDVREWRRNRQKNSQKEKPVIDPDQNTTISL